MLGVDMHQILQIIDISNEIMCSIANGEKKLLSLINATVSHEMRNPLNSIYSQNLNQAQLCEKLKEFIDSDISKISTQKMRSILQEVHNEQSESLKIQTSSTKILNFLVNDMLDFAQLRSGKFRRDLSSFNIKEAIQEIVNVQLLKAEFQGIKLSFVMANFDMNDLVICSDMLRI